MAIEKERKFKLVYMPKLIFSVTKIKQGYLMLEGKRQLRIRICDDKYAFLCYKDCLSKTNRAEYEFQIDIEDAKKLYESCEFKLEKKRYSALLNKNMVDIDIYPSGLEVVEIEYVDELKDEDIPDFCGEEVTGEKQYSNIELAKNGKYKNKSTLA